MSGPQLPLMPLDEYLKTSYPNGDLEYVDGVLVERNVGTIPHGLLQKFLLLHFSKFERQMGIAGIPECRTRVSAARFRIPDVGIVSEPYDRLARYYAGVPVAVIEILSPDDKMKLTLQRFSEYQALGVPFIVQMDPEERTTHVFESSNLIRRELVTIENAQWSIPFDTRALYAQLD